MKKSTQKLEATIRTLPSSKLVKISGGKGKASEEALDRLTAALSS